MSSTREAKSAVSILGSIDQCQRRGTVHSYTLAINKPLADFIGEINTIESAEQVLTTNTCRQNALQYVLSGQLFAFNNYKYQERIEGNIYVEFPNNADKREYTRYQSQQLQNKYVPQIIDVLLKPFASEAKSLEKLLTDRDQDGLTSLHYLYRFKSNHNNIYKKFAPLLKSLSPESQTKIVTVTNQVGNTVLHEMVLRLNSDGLVNHMNYFNSAAMQAAVKMKNTDHNTPVHLLAKYKFADNEAITPYLTSLLKLHDSKSNCNMNEVLSLLNVDKRNVLHLLCQNKSLNSKDKEEACALLINQLKTQESKGQDSKSISLYKKAILAGDKDGYTPIHYACVAGNHNLVTQLLLDKDLSDTEKVEIATRPTKSGMNLLQLAAEHSTKETLDAVLSVMRIDDMTKITTKLGQANNSLSPGDFKSTVNRHTALPAIYQYLKDYRSKNAPDYIRRKNDFIACLGALKGGSSVPLDDQAFRAKEYLGGVFKGSEKYMLLRNELLHIEKNKVIINKFFVYLISQEQSCPLARNLVSELSLKELIAVSVTGPEATVGSLGPRREEGIELRPFPEPQAIGQPSLADRAQGNEGTESGSYRPQLKR
jgi:hypothetical protein